MHHRAETLIKSGDCKIIEQNVLAMLANLNLYSFKKFTALLDNEYQ